MAQPKHSILVTLGNNIRAIRKKTQMSQEDLAFASRLDRTYMGGIERGERNVAVINLCKIAAALAIKPGQLLKGIQWSFDNDDE